MNDNRPGDGAHGENMTRETLADLAAVASIFAMMTIWMFA